MITRLAKTFERIFFRFTILSRFTSNLHIFSHFYPHLKGQPVTQNVSWGVIISTRSLVLQKVARYHAGQYGCAAANDRGENQSAFVTLRIHCKYNIYVIFTDLLSNRQWHQQRQQQTHPTCTSSNKPVCLFNILFPSSRK